ncbi:C40 family peptidase [Novosphingobium sp. EMRT-2]|uniref:C40 family peptidase n=1 Tax=Novosphingobium sp. EMRT-2 TaxID=2571749 RepID=UPI0010BDAF18|nr:C40 family peptidase [Novosphingobium sp. EMRT-2]QCI93544.1 peptidoglycan endopeptidase [Novosphingobium sp. EMRT-2]
MNADLAAAALNLIGTPFRLHGRDPATGLDCVGLVAEAMRRAGFHPVPPGGYGLRALSVDALVPHAGASGLVPVPRDGDVVLARVSPVQAHLLIAAPDGFVHAHAGLRRVTFLPGPLPWPVPLAWRIPSERP